MTLSAPVHHLKRKAKLMSRDRDIPLHAALDRIAAEEGYNGWSLLVSQAGDAAPSAKLFPRLAEGDMVLVGARPGQGKTRFSLELAIAAMKQGRRSHFFTLEYTVKDVIALFDKIGESPAQYDALFRLDSSDGIHAGYIMEQLAGAPRGTVAVIDYLQLLDQKRDTPALSAQVKQLKDFAAAKGIIFVFISQIDRNFETAGKSLPDMSDIRLPNPLDLSLFNKTCFIHNGEVRFRGG